MTILPLVIAPDPRLAVRSEPVETVNDDIRTLMDDMVDTMYDQEGIGLAAVQVGVHKRVLVMDMQEEGQKKPYYIINPEIIDASEEENSYEEGCLSFPEQRAMVVRPKTVTVRHLDYDGNEQTLQCDGLMATCIQHEIDHLNGVVFVDHISKLRRDMVLRKMKKIKKIHFQD